MNLIAGIARWARDEIDQAVARELAATPGVADTGYLADRLHLPDRWVAMSLARLQGRGAAAYTWSHGLTGVGRRLWSVAPQAVIVDGVVYAVACPHCASDVTGCVECDSTGQLATVAGLAAHRWATSGRDRL